MPHVYRSLPRYLIGHQIRPNLVMRNLWREGSIEDNEEYLRSFGDAANCCDCGVCEMFACPMGLSPRKVNGYIKGELRKRGIQVPRNMEPHAREFVDERKTPTDRLVARLGLSAYYGLHAHTCIPWSRRRYSSRSSSTSASPPCLSRPWATRWQRESFWLRPPRTA